MQLPITLVPCYWYEYNKQGGAKVSLTEVLRSHSGQLVFPFALINAKKLTTFALTTMGALAGQFTGYTRTAGYFVTTLPGHKISLREFVDHYGLTEYVLRSPQNVPETASLGTFIITTSQVLPEQREIVQLHESQPSCSSSLTKEPGDSPITLGVTGTTTLCGDSLQVQIDRLNEIIMDHNDLLTTLRDRFREQQTEILNLRMMIDDLCDKLNGPGTPVSPVKSTIFGQIRLPRPVTAAAHQPLTERIRYQTSRTAVSGDSPVPLASLASTASTSASQPAEQTLIACDSDILAQTMHIVIAEARMEMTAAEIARACVRKLFGVSRALRPKEKRRVNQVAMLYGFEKHPHQGDMYICNPST